MWVWSFCCRVELELHWITDLSTFLPNPFILHSLCFLFCSSPPASVSQTSILTSFLLGLAVFVPSVSYISFYLSPPELLSFAPQASELGMLSVYYTYIFTSLVSKSEMLWAFRGNVDFTPTRAHQYSNAVLLCFNEIVHFNSWTQSFILHFNEWLNG